jgi:hypothetical protein
MSSGVFRMAASRRRRASGLFPAFTAAIPWVSESSSILITCHGSNEKEKCPTEKGKAADGQPVMLKL